MQNKSSQQLFNSVSCSCNSDCSMSIWRHS